MTNTVKSMTNMLTFKRIAAQQEVNDRTVRRWYDAAKQELGEFGRIAGNTRLFTEEEGATILQYAPANHIARRITPTVQVEIVDSEKRESQQLPIVPQSVSLEKLAGASVPVIDLSNAHAVLRSIDGIRQAMREKVAADWAAYRESAALADQLDAEMQELVIDAVQSRVEANVARQLQQTQVERTAANLGKFAEYTADASG